MARYLLRFASERFWMSWSSVKTICRGSWTRVMPRPLNFAITAELLSWVMTWRGLMETKSPARTGRGGGPSARWRSVIFSTTV